MPQTRIRDLRRRPTTLLQITAVVQGVVTNVTTEEYTTDKEGNRVRVPSITVTKRRLTPEVARAMSLARKARAGVWTRSKRRPRCACQAMTLKRAKARGHKCEAAS